MSFKSHIRHFGTTSVCKMAELCSSTRRHIKEWRNKVKSIDERELDTCFDYDLQQLHSLIYFYFKVYFGFCLETSVIPLMLLEGSHPKRNNITISNSSAALSFMEDSVLFLSDSSGFTACSLFLFSLRPFTSTTRRYFQQQSSESDYTIPVQHQMADQENLWTSWRRKQSICSRR